MFYGWTNASILFFIYFVTLGLTFYGFSVIFPVMIETMGWGRAEAALAHSINALLTGFLAPLVAFMVGRLGSRKTLIFGLSILITALCLLGTLTEKLWHWIIIWGFIIPFGFAFAGLLPIQTTVNFWFDKRRAMVLGLVLSGAALGGSISQPLFMRLIQMTMTWRVGWLTAGACTLLALLGSFFINDKPDGIIQFPDGISPVKKTKKSDIIKAKTYRTIEEWSLTGVLKTPTAWFLLFYMITLTMAVFMVSAHGVLHLTDLYYSPMEAASALSLIFLSSGIARFTMGWMGDLIEPRWIGTMAMFFTLISIFALWQAPNLKILMVFSPIFGFSYGTAYVMFSASIANYYGANCFPHIFGFMLPCLTIFSALVPFGAAYIVDKYSNYDLAFILLIILIAAGLVCAALSKPPVKSGTAASTVVL